MTLEEVWDICCRAAFIYERNTGPYLSSIAYTALDMAGAGFERMLKYNREYITREVIDTRLLYKICMRHFAVVARREYRRLSLEVSLGEYAVPCGSGLHDFEYDLKFAIGELEKEVRDALEKKLLQVLFAPDNYWEWSRIHYTDARQPTLERLARYMSVSKYRMRRAVKQVRKELKTKGVEVCGVQ